MDETEIKIQLRRRQRLERSGVYPILSEEAALQFLEDVGLCGFSQHGEVEIPCFTDALADEVKDEAWGWKDSLPNTRRVYYGTIFRFNQRDSIRPGFLALPVLTACYALSPVLQFGGDRDLLPRWTGLSHEALRLADALERAGSLSTSAMRKATALDGKAHSTLFNKALIEAQRNFLIVRTGVTSTTRANYGYIWESFPRAYPRICADAEGLTAMDAASRILRQYVDTVVVTRVERAASVLALDLGLMQKAEGRLIEEGVLGRDEQGWLMMGQGIH
ncbi:MAG: hypothetical protein IH586_22935 [Anaerolineaceae bacterium]|nr:hypothetical protein [Anaerolineaceae bacterium]